MQAQLWTDTLKLLSLMVIGSRDTERLERELFKEAALSLRDKVYPKLNLTADMAGDWLDLHRSSLKRSMSSVYFDDTLKTILNNLKHLPNKDDVILTMIKITLADTGRTKNETRIISEIHEAWGIPNAISA